MSRTAAWIGLRYLRARQGSRFVGFISGIAMAGIALGVFTLVVVLSVMNGFEKEVRQRIVNTNYNVFVLPRGGLGFTNYQAIMDTVMAHRGVVSVSPFVRRAAMLTFGGGGGISGHSRVMVHRRLRSSRAVRIATMRPGRMRRSTVPLMAVAGGLIVTLLTLAVRAALPAVAYDLRNLGLAQLETGSIVILHGLPDFRIALHGNLYGVAQTHGACRNRRQ